jgi:hypothetical protein
MTHTRQLKAINKYCPRSGKLVKPDSLITYRGYTIGFSNPRFRSDFLTNIGKKQNDRDFFDGLINEMNINKPNNCLLVIS